MSGTFLVVTTAKAVLLASGGWRPDTLLGPTEPRTSHRASSAPDTSGAEAERPWVACQLQLRQHLVSVPTTVLPTLCSHSCSPTCVPTTVFPSLCSHRCSPTCAPTTAFPRLCSHHCSPTPAFPPLFSHSCVPTPIFPPLFSHLCFHCCVPTAVFPPLCSHPCVPKLLPCSERTTFPGDSGSTRKDFLSQCIYVSAVHRPTPALM